MNMCVHVLARAARARARAACARIHPPYFAGQLAHLPPTDPPNPIPHRSIEKIIAHHGVGLTRPFVAPGEAVCVRVDWTMANELTLVGITDSEFRSRPATATDPRPALTARPATPRHRNVHPLSLP